MEKNSIKYWIIGLIGLIYACDNKKKTGYREIDDNYIFKKSEVVFKEDILLKRYFLDSKSDSVYAIIKNSKDEVSRGWTYKFVRIGDWFFESKKQLDSIYNYVNYCEGVHHINTIQYFVDGEPQNDKGYWFEFSYDTINLREKMPIDIDIKVNYDKTLYEKNIALYFFRESISNANYCYFKELKKDSLPSFGEDYYSFEIIPKYKGKHSINGYFVLLPNKQSNSNDMIDLKPIFFKLDLNVK
ncbi:hypothetical protein [Myroides odoratus]|uniref:Lipoprotein n=1 Tax=Myroides odoratus TaxID=256 RepID=A0A9Q7E7C1_MYROD|nr:hypothetical protein [Myroides odoratus]EHQ41266.1 hypothetical protein Myrod_0429 [Myroides odoratus DSM 2801]EKB08564.1 hypothetical protein HMPREF9716_00915 [Myroides odoratus CIP 103059]QQT98711.1 hypothetical protein I6I88_10805 [Myroides odoratus]WQD59113.1 hypothetical protein U0010_08170 [Myroides odoratus]STZ32305.1 Uncharacterised protein [Myroides odoratus]